MWSGDMETLMIDTTRWEEVYWPCPHCGERLYPIDSCESGIDLSLEDIRNETDAYQKTMAHDPIVICPTCEREFDVNLTPHAEGFSTPTMEEFVEENQTEDEL